jgi:hypothetical protein
MMLLQLWKQVRPNDGVWNKLRIMLFVASLLLTLNACTNRRTASGSPPFVTFIAYAESGVNEGPWGAPLAASLDAFCRRQHNYLKLQPIEGETFIEKRRLEPGYDDVRQGEKVRVVGQPVQDRCIGAEWVPILLLGAPARAGSTRGWVQTMNIQRHN